MLLGARRLRRRRRRRLYLPGRRRAALAGGHDFGRPQESRGGGFRRFSPRPHGPRPGHWRGRGRDEPVTRGPGAEEEEEERREPAGPAARPRVGRGVRGGRPCLLGRRGWVSGAQAAGARVPGQCVCRFFFFFLFPSASGDKMEALVGCGKPARCLSPPPRPLSLLAVAHPSLGFASPRSAGLPRPSLAGARLGDQISGTIPPRPPAPSCVKNGRKGNVNAWGFFFPSFLYESLLGPALCGAAGYPDSVGHPPPSRFSALMGTVRVPPDGSVCRETFRFFQTKGLEDRGVCSPSMLAFAAGGVPRFFRRPPYREGAGALLVPLALFLA